jgi:hypothetical protein
VAVLLTVVGVGIVWTSDSRADDPGSFRSGTVGDLCEKIDVSALEKLTPQEDGRKGDAKPKGKPPLFSCEVRLLADKDAGGYLAVTLDVEARVLASVKDAEDAFAGAVDYEKSKGRKVADPKFSDGQAAAVTVSDADDQHECRVHVRSSNAVLSVTMFVTGAGLDCGDGADILLDVGAATLDVMGSE